MIDETTAVLDKLDGKIIKVFYKSDRWSSVKVESDFCTIVCKGKISNPVEGCDIRMEGTYVDDPKYGLQFDVQNCVVKMPENAEGILSYLNSGLIKGVGKKLARRIVARFGKDSLNVIKKHPERLLEVPGISSKKLESIKESYKQSSQYFELYDLLNGKITANQAAKIFDKYGDKAVEKIKKNPYCLIYDIDGFGFIRADTFAIAMGIPKDSSQRIGAAAYYVLEQGENDGHCYLGMKDVEDGVIKLLIPPNGKGLQVRFINRLYEVADDWENEREEFFAKAKLNSDQKEYVEDWVKEREHYLDVLADAIIAEVRLQHIFIDDDRIYAKALYFAEKDSAEIIAKMIKSGPIRQISHKQLNRAIKEAEEEKTLEDGVEFKLGPQQIQAIEMVGRYRFFVITGGPGRGKTTIIRAIIKSWGNDDKVILCAPTGRAAQRMKEATGHDASTIHRLVARHDRTPSGDKIEGSKQYLIIVDETSMLDIQLLKKILEFAQHSTLIFVGDVDQLPSIGPGMVLKNLVENPYVPTMRLTEAYRNSGSLETNANKANEGDTLSDFVFDDQCHFIEAGSEQVQDTVVDIYMKAIKKYGIEGVCVLAPMRKRSHSGTEELNVVLQNTVNPATAKNKINMDNCPFRIGDRVMETQNNAKKDVLLDGFPDHGVYNGDCGTITGTDEEDGEVIIRLDDGRITRYRQFELDSLRLCYAMTIHKSQGSEYPCTIVIANMEHFIMLKRKLIYTAMTRVKQEMYMVGDKKAFNMAIRTVTDDARNTWFTNRINEEMRKPIK